MGDSRGKEDDSIDSEPLRTVQVVRLEQPWEETDFGVYLFPLTGWSEGVTHLKTGRNVGFGGVRGQ